MSRQPFPRTGEYRMSDTLPDTAPDASYVSQYEYLWRKNPAWLLGLKQADGTPYYVPGQVAEPLAVAA